MVIANDKKTQENKTSSSSLIERMFEAGAHYGFSRRRRHPSFGGLLFGSKDALDIIDLEKTYTHLIRALEFVKECGRDDKTVLFVGTKPEARRATKDVAISLGMPYVTFRWIGGTLTNFQEIKKRIARMEKLLEQKEKGELAVYTKKERLVIDDEIEHLERNFSGIAPMKKTPGAIVVVDPRYEEIAVREALRLNIPVVALAGSDCDIKGIAYPIPANDSSIKSIEFFVKKLAESFQEGQNARRSEKDTAPSADGEGAEGAAAAV